MNLNNNNNREDLICGQYQIIKLLEESKFSTIYLAEDTRLPSHPRCFVKKLKLNHSDPKVLTTAKRLLDREANTLYKLTEHPQIPRLLAHCQENEQLYLIEEFIEGENLSKEIIEGEQWNEELVKNFLEEILNILVEIQKHRVIHRDLKPSNLMRRASDGKIVIVDFGSVKEIRTHMSSSKTIIVGTPGYMPPEQLNGKPQLNSDIYALGMICIQALTGKLPRQLERDDKGETIWRNYAKVSRKFANILDNMIRSKASERYQSANQVLNALKSLKNSNYKFSLPLFSLHKKSNIKYNIKINPTYLILIFSTLLNLFFLGNFFEKELEKPLSKFDYIHSQGGLRLKYSPDILLIRQQKNTYSNNTNKAIFSLHHFCPCVFYTPIVTVETENLENISKNTENQLSLFLENNENQTTFIKYLGQNLNKNYLQENYLKEKKLTTLKVKESIDKSMRPHLTKQEKWIVKNNILYLITYKATKSKYHQCLNIVEEMINSIQIEQQKIKF